MSRRKTHRKVTPSPVVIRAKRPDLDWSDPKLMFLDCRQMIIDSTAYLVTLLEKQQYFRSILAGDLPGEGNPKLLEYIDFMVEEAEVNRDRLLQVQAMQELFRAAGLNPDVERNSPYRSKVTFDELAQMARKLGLDNGQ